MMYLAFFALMFIVNSNDRPIIGVFTIPALDPQYSPSEYSQIRLEYVNQLESAGAMVIPISWQSSQAELDFILERVNGILFTGGSVDIDINISSPGYKYNKFTRSASYIITQAIFQNKNGRVLPIMGTCRGLQLLHYVLSEYYPVLTHVTNNTGKSRLLNITSPNSEMFQNMDPKVIEYLETVNGPYYNHYWGVIPETYLASKTLNSLLKITSLSKDQIGLNYVASAEGINYPIYAYQFHSEKHAFDWESPCDHEPMHIQMANHFAELFISKARQSENRFTEDELATRLIYNFQPVQTNTFSLSYFIAEKKKNSLVRNFLKQVNPIKIEDIIGME